MSNLAFERAGTFWRGNLHTHSTLSDGVLPPAEVCRRYRAEGYDFISLTDHMVGLYDYPIARTEAFRGDGFSTILGAELHSGAMENGEICHILAVRLPDAFAPSNTPHFAARDVPESGAQLAPRARDSASLMAVAPPESARLTTALHRCDAAVHPR